MLASRNDFKMNTCGIHPQGTLLLDMSHLKLLEESIKILAELQEKSKGEHIDFVKFQWFINGDLLVLMRFPVNKEDINTT